nr:MAG TPA: hypothetical protein [Crassvirales sp.]
MRWLKTIVRIVIVSYPRLLLVLLTRFVFLLV